jgi:hypothetical protein
MLLCNRLVTTKEYTCDKHVVYGHQGHGGYPLCEDKTFALKKNDCLVYSFGSVFSKAKISQAEQKLFFVASAMTGLLTTPSTRKWDVKCTRLTPGQYETESACITV